MCINFWDHQSYILTSILEIWESDRCICWSNKLLEVELQQTLIWKFSFRLQFLTSSPMHTIWEGTKIFCLCNLSSNTLSKHQNQVPFTLKAHPNVCFGANHLVFATSFKLSHKMATSTYKYCLQFHEPQTWSISNATNCKFIRSHME